MLYFIVTPQTKTKLTEKRCFIVKKRFLSLLIPYSLIFCAVANSYPLLLPHPKALWLILGLFLFIQLFAGTMVLGARKWRLRICCHGTLLLWIFVICVTLSVVYQLMLAFRLFSPSFGIADYLGGILFCIGAHFILFWNGILCVYLTSMQLGIKHRLIGVICGMIPLFNLFALRNILKITYREMEFEIGKEQQNACRQAQQLCATKYPILLVHGVFFRDFAYFNYWGRIPAELETNGARIFYGNHQSAASVADSAGELTARIQEILRQTGAEKINIIAHSKGGLDCRYAMANLGIAPLVASLTTINTPHRGCLFADYLLTKIPQETQDKVATVYNNALKKLGDHSPDFLAAVNDLTDSACQPRDADFSAPEGVFCQSIGSVLKKAGNGKFPMNFSYHLVKYFDGDNDGLVSENSFRWGERYTLLRPTGQRGISHGDMIDLNRENVEGFDVREFYVNLVNDLKNRGL